MALWNRRGGFVNHNEFFDAVWAECLEPPDVQLAIGVKLVVLRRKLHPTRFRILTSWTLGFRLARV